MGPGNKAMLNLLVLVKPGTYDIIHSPVRETNLLCSACNCMHLPNHAGIEIILQREKQKLCTLLFAELHSGDVTHLILHYITCPTPIRWRIGLNRVGVGVMRQHQLWVSYFTTSYRHRHFA